MNAQELWMAANAPWLAVGGLALAAVISLFVLRARSAQRQRRAQRFREAVRSEARRILSERRAQHEAGDGELTRVLAPSVPVTRHERRGAPSAHHAEGG